MPKKTTPMGALSGIYNLSATPTAQTKRALDGAFPEAPVEEAAAQVVAGVGRSHALIPVREIRPNPYQPRQTFNEEKLQQLATSIKENGLLQPILIRKASDSGYELVAGERRWRATILAGLETISADILEQCNDAMMESVALIENLLREQLTPIELASAYKALLDRKDPRGDSMYTIRSLAAMLHQSPGHIDDHIALWRVPAEVRQLIIDDATIPLRVIREIGKIENHADQALLIQEVRARSFSQADVVAILRAMREENKKQTANEPEAKAEKASPLVRAIFLKKFQNERRQFEKSISQISQSWGQLDREAKAEIHTDLRTRIQLLEEVIQSHPLE